MMLQTVMPLPGMHTLEGMPSRCMQELYMDPVNQKLTDIYQAMR